MKPVRVFYNNPLISHHNQKIHYPCITFIFNFALFGKNKKGAEIRPLFFNNKFLQLDLIHN